MGVTARGGGHAARTTSFAMRRADHDALGIS